MVLREIVLLMHPNTLARVEARSCQILINKDPSADAIPFNELTEQELVTKANEAVENMGVLEGGGELRFVGVKKLANRGIVFDLDTQEEVGVIQSHREGFLCKFSMSAVVEEWAVSVIVEYIPVSHVLDALAEQARIECNSGIPQSMLITTRWIKPIQRCSPGQQSVHLIACFSTTAAANITIRDGLVIVGKHTWARRMRRELQRCFKCQKYASIWQLHVRSRKHVVHVCVQSNTEQQPARRQTQTSSAVLIVMSWGMHASWDRTCLKFIRASKRIERGDLESTYKFFPDENPWTWEQQDTQSNMAAGRPLAVVAATQQRQCGASK